MKEKGLEVPYSEDFVLTIDTEGQSPKLSQVPSLSEMTQATDKSEAQSASSDT